MTQPLRIILADDHEVIRQGIRALFATSPDVVVVDDVGDVETAVARVRDLAPDVLLIDLSARGESYIDGRLASVFAHRPHARAIRHAARVVAGCVR